MHSREDGATSLNADIVDWKLKWDGDNYSRLQSRPYPPRHLLADVTKSTRSSPNGRDFDAETSNGIFCLGGPEVIAASATKVVLEAHSSSFLSEIWMVLSRIFCFPSAAYYMPDDDYILYCGSMEEDEHVESDSNSILQHSKSFIENSLKVFDWSNDFPSSPISYSLVFSREGDYANDKLLLGRDLFEEGQRIMKLFTGLIREKGLTLNWVLRATKASDNINVHTCDVPDSPWLAIKSDCIIRRDKETILQLMMDDTRSSEYDDSMEGYEVTT